MQFAFQAGTLSSLLLKFCGCLELCLYGNLVKEDIFLKAIIAASNPKDIGLDEKASRTQYHKIGRIKNVGYAAAAAKSLQSCPTLCDPIDSSPPGSPIPGILQARTLEWVAISFSNA